MLLIVGGGSICFISNPTTDVEPYRLTRFDTATRRAGRAIPLKGTSRTLPINVITISPDERWLIYAQRDLLDYDLMLVENFQ